MNRFGVGFAAAAFAQQPPQIPSPAVMPDHRITFTDTWPLVKNGYIDVPMKPGMGIKVNEEAIRPLCRQGEFFTDPTTRLGYTKGLGPGVELVDQPCTTGFSWRPRPGR